ncbi:prepilin peptidase [Haloferula sp. A504]|uniref:prepilin peptidase n=1 Tax=Haloferula sp. A504 TaxID=3373601 RepID=UPI0031C63BD8|nr:prepilin peptidase [Verrucomicrobiaceae bacterium E54]
MPELGFTGRVIYPPLDHPVWLLAAFLVGACIGSFLNVVIYRLPLGLSVNDPKRSFCPGCKAEIPLRLNIPLVSWLWLRGKCRSCGTRISARYFAVELLTALLFTAVLWVMADRLGGARFQPAHLAVIPLWFLIASFVAIAFIDAEHLVIPLELTISGTVAGFIGALLCPQLPDLIGWRSMEPGWLDGLIQSGLGFLIGFFGLWIVVLLGKLAFGRVEWAHDEPVEWFLEEPSNEEDPIHFQMGEDRLAWWDIFYRKSDRLIIEAETLEVDGEWIEGGTLKLHEEGLILPDGREIKLEDLKALRGTAKKAVVPREAMGMGDVHLMGVIGAFFGPFGVFFSLLAGSLYAIAAAILGRIGFGMRLPFGPFLVLGALTWFFGGWKLAEWYVASLR